MTLLDHPIIGQRYFFPRPSAPDKPVMVAVDGATLACVHITNGHPLTLLHFHGNGEVVNDYVPDFARMVHAMGADTFHAEYRGYGGSTGTPKLAAMLDDVAAVAEALGSPERTVVFGRSVGSIYAVEYAHRFPNAAGLILESGIADVHERIRLRVDPRELGVDRATFDGAFAERFDHRAKLADWNGPTLIMHAQHDHLVDVSHAERNAAWCGSNTTLEIFARGDHNSIFFANHAAYRQAMTDFFDNLRG